MVENSKIEWCDHTFNSWVGCAKVSPACDHCYAEGWAKRTGQAHLWNGERRRTSTANWKQVATWDRKAMISGKRAKVFCASLADVFDNQADPEWRAMLWRLIAGTSALDWLLLTKRPQNIAKMLPPDWGGGYPNVWLGTTVENQQEADRRIPHLLAAPAAKRFLSCEPLLGPVMLHDWLTGDWHPTMPPETTPRIDWVIVGGESGPGARPMHPVWARSLRDQCASAGVPFFFKQWGEWAPDMTHAGIASSGPDTTKNGAMRKNGLWRVRFDDAPSGSESVVSVQSWNPPHFSNVAFRVGKKRAGAMLDGKLWREMPA